MIGTVSRAARHARSRPTLQGEARLGQAGPGKATPGKNGGTVDERVSPRPRWGLIKATQKNNVTPPINHGAKYFSTASAPRNPRQPRRGEAVCVTRAAATSPAPHATPTPQMKNITPTSVPAPPPKPTDPQPLSFLHQTCLQNKIDTKTSSKTNGPTPPPKTNKRRQTPVGLLGGLRDSAVKKMGQ